MPKQRIVYLGSGAFGLPTLQRLVADHHVLAVVTQPDKPAGRGKTLTPTPIGDWASTNLPAVPLLKPENVNDITVREKLQWIDADAWVVIAFGQKLSPELLTDTFAINLHASLLPRWRGAAPINAAMLAGDPTTGNSVITLADRMDAGLILAQSPPRPITPDTTAGELHDLLAADGPDLVSRVLADHRTNSLKPLTQDESQVTKARKLSKADGVLDFHKPAADLRRQIHGLTPWPGVSIRLNGEQIKLLRVADAATGGADVPARLLDAKSGTLTCGHSTTLRILNLQPAGGKPMTWNDFLRGRGTLSTGAQVSSGA